ncbi:MAG: nicotinate-nucleotide adenylyltransferase [Parafilimonas sp.]|nr:nicotinate-nucleotide adenylyltransferase [Parafilimonas sp.]
MHTGLLFGSFNPIHTGHLIIANYFINQTVDKVRFVVSPQNPFKNKADLLNESSRLELVELATANNDVLSATNIEFSLPKPSFTINTLNLLSKKEPGENFYIIMGSDNFSQLASWKSSDEIIKNYKILVYERPGYSLPKSNISPNIQLFKTPLIEISSTLIRNMISENKSIRYLVPEEVYKEIMVKGYFK